MRVQRILIVVVLMTVAGLGYVSLRGSDALPRSQPDSEQGNKTPPRATAAAGQQPAPAQQGSGTSSNRSSGRELRKATFAAGCFWSTESDFDKVQGVLSTTSGYTGGTFSNPTYEQVSSGGTGHAESVEILFDPSLVSYEQLLDHYWHNVDPFVSHGQFCDIGEQYHPAIFVHDPAQRAAAEASRAVMRTRFSKPIVVSIAGAGSFYPAEDYHQDFHTRNSIRYRYYRWGCGRDARLAEIWGQPPT